MKHTLTLEIGTDRYSADLNQPLDISLMITGDGTGPSCYFSGHPDIGPIISGDFIGDVSRGGSVNHKYMRVVPHGHGTHTECFGHISSDESGVISNLFTTIYAPCLVCSVTPAIEKEDLIIHTIDSSIPRGIEAIAIRTIPNSTDKKRKDYSGINPPYLNADLVKLWQEAGINHILIDLPSIDREQDQGRLAAHKAHFGENIIGRNKKTVTELIYIPQEIPDGLYLLNIQILNIQLDVSPSRPVLYSLKKL